MSGRLATSSCTYTVGIPFPVRAHIKERDEVSLYCLPVQVCEDGRSVSLLGERVLAGSCCSLEDTLRSLVRVLEVPLGEAVAMLSENPARSVGTKSLPTHMHLPSQHTHIPDVHVPGIHIPSIQ